MLNIKLKRIIALILSVFMISTVGVSLVGCAPKPFTVTFTAGEKEGEATLAEGYDESYLVQTVTSASQLKPPKFISKDKYHNGWDKVISRINSNTRVSALWVTKSYSVTIKYNLEYPLYEGTKYHTLVQSKFNKSANELERLGFIKSDDEAYVYYKYDVPAGTDLAQDEFLPKFTPFDTQEYYFSAWKYRKGSKKVTIKSGTPLIINSINFPNAEEDGIIELLAAVGAYWTPGYV